MRSNKKALSGNHMRAARANQVTGARRRLRSRRSVENEVDNRLLARGITKALRGPQAGDAQHLAENAHRAAS
jgi:hypothetical protein